MWRYLTVFLIGGVLGTGFGVALGFFLFPYVFPPPEAMETLGESERTAVVARGDFSSARHAPERQQRRRRRLRRDEAADARRAGPFETVAFDRSRVVRDVVAFFARAGGESHPRDARDDVEERGVAGSSLVENGA